MKRGKVISLDDYKGRRQAESLSEAGIETKLPGADRLWELLDRNLTISAWEKKH